MYNVGRDVLSNDRKEAPADCQGHWSGERLVERPWLQLMCCAPVSYDGKYPINNIISFLFYIITNFFAPKLLLSTPIGS